MSFPQILRYRKILDIDLTLNFLKNLRKTADVRLIKFQHLIQKSDFDTYYERRVFNLPKKPATSKYKCGESLNITFFSNIRSSLPFLKNMRTTANVELINFQYSKHKIDIQTYYKKRHQQKRHWEPISEASSNISFSSDINSP